MSWPTIAVSLYHDSAWNDYGTSCLGFSIDRGRQRLLDRHKAGTFTVVMDNSAGTFDSSYNADMVADMPIRIRVTVPSGKVFQVAGGTVDEFDVQWDGPESSTCTITATDGFKQLALVAADCNALWDSSVRGPVTAGTATDVGLDSIVLNSLKAGTSFGYVKATYFRNHLQDMTAVVDNALEVCQKVADAENGEFFGSTWGAFSTYGSDGASFRFIGMDARWAASVATFSDNPSGGEFPYNSQPLKGRTDDDFLRNSASVTRTGGVEQTDENTASITAHYERPYTLSGTYASADIESLVLAEHIVTYRADPGEFGFDQLVLDPHNVNTNAYWDIVVGCCTVAGSVLDEGTIDFSSRITVQKNRPYGTELSREVFVTGLRHEVSNSQGNRTWTTTLSLADATPWPTTTLILGTGLLGTATLG